MVEAAAGGQRQFRGHAKRQVGWVRRDRREGASLLQVLQDRLSQVEMPPFQQGDAWPMVRTFHRNRADNGLKRSRDRDGRQAGGERRHLNPMDASHPCEREG